MPKSFIRITALTAFLAGASSGFSQNKPQSNAGPRFQVVETPIDDIHTAMRSGSLTARGLVQAYLDRIRAFAKQGPTLTCIITVSPRALAAAAKLNSPFQL